MRPTGLEALRALRFGIGDVLAPEVQSAFAQDTANVLQMLIESLSAEWDTAADDLHRDNQQLSTLLSDIRDALAAGEGNADTASTVNLLEETLAAPVPASLTLTALREHNTRLRAALEKALPQIERQAGEPDSGELGTVRLAAYRHLRQVAGRGWSFWDVASFREYMANYRAGARG